MKPSWTTEMHVTSACWHPVSCPHSHAGRRGVLSLCLFIRGQLILTLSHWSCPVNWTCRETTTLPSWGSRSRVRSHTHTVLHVEEIIHTESVYLLETRLFICFYLNLSIAAVISADEGQAVVFVSAQSHSTGLLRLLHWDNGSYQIWENS